MSLFAICDQTEVLARQAAHGAAEAAVQAAYHQYATDLCILTLSQEMADRLNAPLNDVYYCLYNAPANLHLALQSPQGWAAMAGHLAAEFGCEPDHYRPQVH